MAGEAELVGNVVTGAVLATAVESGSGGTGGTAEGACANCATPLSGSFCHQCGQKANVHRTLRGFGHDILHSVLHFDGKIWRTLPLLAWKPGELTRRYVHGERAKFVSPIALFLFMVFFSFAVFSWIAPNAANIGASKPTTAAEAAKALAEDRTELLGDIRELQKEKQAAIAEGMPRGSYAWMDGQIERHQEALKKLDGKDALDIRTRLVAERKLAIAKARVDAETAALEAKIAAARKAGKPTKALEEELAGDRRASKMLGNAHDVADGSFDAENADINFLGYKPLEDAARQAFKNPQLVAYKMQSNAYKFSWALIPISLPFVWLLFFWRREFKMFDHAVFITYSLCFMMALAALGGIMISRLGSESFAGVSAILTLIFVPPLHIYRQVKGAYQTSRFGALWRMFAIANFAGITLGLFFSLIVTLGVI